jgi:hypothetical protein
MRVFFAPLNDLLDREFIERATSTAWRYIIVGDTVDAEGLPLATMDVRINAQKEFEVGRQGAKPGAAFRPAPR